MTSRQARILRAISLGAVFLTAAANSVAAQQSADLVNQPGPIAVGSPLELKMTRAASSDLDLRLLPQTAPERQERPEREPPPVTPVELPGGPPAAALAAVPGPNAPAPATIVNFDGLDFLNWGHRPRAICVSTPAE
jgi:hypothetical protein